MRMFHKLFRACFWTLLARFLVFLSGILFEMWQAVPRMRELQCLSYMNVALYDREDQALRSLVPESSPEIEPLLLLFSLLAIVVLRMRLLYHL